MKKLILSFLVLPLFSSCSHKVYDAIDWQSNKVKVDGKIDEWSDPLRFYDYKSKINYTISNDRDNLYVCMKISDYALKLKIVRGGMEFRIDTSGKKVFPIAFIFPIANQIVIKSTKRGEGQSQRNRGEQPDYSALNQKPIAQARDAELIGFKFPLGGPLSMLNNTSGIEAVANIDSTGVMNYEAKIPFSTFYRANLTKADTNKVFCYEIKINPLPAQQTHENPGGGQHSGMGGGQHSGMGGGGMGGGMGGGGMGGHHGGGGGRGGQGGQHSNTNNSGNNDLYEKTQIIKALRFSFQ